MPHIRHQQARSQHLATTHWNSPPSPKQPRRQRLKTNITSLESLERITMALDKLLQRYLDRPRRNYRTLPNYLRDLVSAAHADCLHPSNAVARIRVAGIVQREIARFGIPAMTPLRWITIAPGRFAMPIEDAKNYNLKPFIASIRQALADVPFIAFIEAAHYRPSRRLGPYRGDVVSWHAHLLTMGASTYRVLELLKPFKKRHQNFVGRRCVHIVPIEPDEVSTKALYASKAQIKSYRHFLKRETEIDPETGEIMHRMGQGKELIRTGDHVRMIEMFDRMRIDQLVFGNGIGTDLVNVIRFKAMRPYCRWAANEIANDPSCSDQFPFVAQYQRLGNQLRRKLGEGILGQGPIQVGRPVSRERQSPNSKNSLKRF